MKKRVLIGLLLASAGAFAFSGPRDDMRMLFDSLDLTASQKAQLVTIRKESRDARFKLMDAMEALRDKTQTRVLAVLTDEQKVLYRQQRADMRGKHKSQRCDRDKMGIKHSKCD